MLTDLRVKLRNRRSRISSCGFEDFLPLTRQFFAFLDSSPVLKAVIAELLARNQESVSLVEGMTPEKKRSERAIGETAGLHHRWRIGARMDTEPESTLTHQQILERFRRLFHRDLTPEERRIFFLPDSGVQVDPSKPQKSDRA
jgi:hypothetical protein